jgi:hypothetical protein
MGTGPPGAGGDSLRKSAELGWIRNHVDFGDPTVGDGEGDDGDWLLARHDDHAGRAVHDCGTRVGGEWTAAL